MQISFDNGLLFTSIQLKYKGKIHVIDNVVIDTGAARSLLSADAVESIDIRFENDDKIVTMYGIGGEEHAFEKNIDEIRLGDTTICNYDIHFGTIDPDGEINGLLGLDLLMKAELMIDFKNLLISKVL